MNKTILLESISVILALTIMGILVTNISGNEYSNSLNITLNESELPFTHTFNQLIELALDNSSNNSVTVINTQHASATIQNVDNHSIELEIIVSIEEFVVNGTVYYNEELLIQNNDITIKTHAINITILDDDQDNDGFTVDDCNDQNPNIHPGQNDIPGNNIDEDCSGSDTPVSLTSSISPTNINIGGSTTVTVNAPLGTNITINVCPPSPTNPTFEYYSNCNNLIDELYAGQEYTITESDNYGQYVLNVTLQYNNYTDNKKLKYFVNNNLAINVQGDLTITDNERLVLAAATSGGSSPYTYQWKIGSNTYSGSILNVSLSVGNYSVEVKSTDNYNNQVTKTVQVEVSKLYTLTVKVLNSVGGALKDANVEVKNIDTTTDVYGKVTYLLTAGEYDINIDANGYYSKSVTTTINQNKNVEVQLEVADEIEPQITVLTADNKANSALKDRIEYIVEDNQRVECSLMIKDGEWFSKSSSVIIENDKAKKDIVHAFDISTDSFEEIIYTIQCKDKDGNLGKTDEKKIILGQVTKTVQANAEKKILLDELYDIQDAYDKFTGNKKSVATTLKLIQKLQDDIKLVERAIRDINDVVFRKDLNDDEKNAYREQKSQEIEEIYQSTIVDFELKDSNKFVNYPTDSELRELLNSYYDRELSDNEFNGLKQLQNDITVTTEIYELTIQYLNDQNRDQLLVSKKISYDKDLRNTEKIVIFSNTIESIIDGIEYSDEEYVIVSNEAVFFTSNADTTEAEKMYAILIPKNIPIAVKTTGRVTFEGGNTAVTGGIILFIVLVLFVLSRSKKVKILYYHFRKNSNYHKLMLMIHQAENILDDKDYDKASLIYREIKLMYAHLTPYEKNKIYDEVLLLCDLLNSNYINSKVEELKTNPVDKTALQKIKVAYNELRGEMQEIIYPKIKDYLGDRS